MVGLLLASLVLARIQNGSRNAGQIDPVGKVVGAVSSPVSLQLGAALDRNSRFWSAIWASEELRRENQRLKSLEASWNLYETNVRSLEEQINAMRRTLSMPDLPKSERVPADIVNYDPGTSRIALSVGASSGVVQGQAVVTGDGFVGQVQTVDKNRSQVLLMSSPVLRIGAMIPGTPPVTGLIRGQGPRRLVFEIVEGSRVFKQGEPVVTSLHSERTPANISIGIVLSQEPAQEYGITRLIVLPTVDLAGVREVFVLK